MASRSRKSSNDALLLQGIVVAVAAVWLLGIWETTAGKILLVVVAVGGAWGTIAFWRWQLDRERIHADTLGQLLELSPTQFEHAVAQLLADEGHTRVQVHGGAGDLQADVTSRAPDGRLVVVQCKRYRPGNKVGSPTVQAFIGMATVHHRAARSMIVTTSTFTGPAVDLARGHDIELVDGDALVRRVRATATPERTDTSRPTARPVHASERRHEGS